MLRRSFTLLEVLIALPLAAILISFSTYYYTSFQRANSKIQQLASRELEKRYLSKRLQQILSRSIPYQKPSLSDRGAEFTFDNAKSAQETLSHHIHARLHFNSDKKELKLALCNRQQPGRALREETLLSFVEQIKFIYLFESKSKEESKSPFQVDEATSNLENGRWVALKLEVTYSYNPDETEYYFFTLKRSHSPIAA